VSTGRSPGSSTITQGVPVFRSTTPTFVIATLAAAGCEPGAGDPLPEGRDPLASAFRTEAQYEERLAEVAAFDDTNGEITLGRGYNVFGEFANTKEVTQPVLDYAALDADGLVDSFETGIVEITKTAGSSLREYTDSLSAKASIAGSSGGFSGSVNTSFSQSTLRRMEYSYATVHSESFERRVQILETDPNDLRAYLTAQALEDIDDPSFPADLLIDEYGGYVLVDIFLGGRLDYNLAMDLSSVASATAFELAAEASYRNLIGSVSGAASLVTESDRLAFEQHAITQTFVQGGEGAQVAVNLTEETHSAWLDSVEDNQVLVGFAGDRPMIALWEFAADPARAEAIEEAFLAKADGLTAGLEDGPVELMVILSMKVPNDKDADERRGDLEIYGDVSALAAADLSAGVFEQEEVLFDRLGGSPVVVKENVVRRISDSVIEFPAFDEEESGIRLASSLIERDGGPSSDDNMGEQAKDLHFRNLTVDLDGNPIVENLIGRHTVTHVAGGAHLELIYDILLLD
jgi:hypothetical protein